MWEVKKIKDIALVTAGQSPEGKYYNEIGVGLPFYQGKKEFTERMIGEPKVWTSYITKEALEGDVLMSVRAPVGPVNFATQKCCIGRGLASIRVKEKFDKDFLFLFFKNIENQLIGNSGAVFNSINKSQIENIEIPIPPLEEQQAIVAKLDQAFAAIDQAKANIEKNIANAKELFQSKLNQIFSQKSEDWVNKKLSDIFDVRDGTHDSPKYYDKGYPLITSKNLKNGKIFYDKIKYINEEDYININKRSKVNIGDILFAMIGTIGNPVVVCEEPNFAIKNVALIKSNKENNSHFYKFYLDSKIVINKMQTESKGATQKFVSLGYLRDFVVPNPKIEIQQHIVSQLEQLQEQTNLLVSKYEQKLANLEELKKSILEKAFKGELV